MDGNTAGDNSATQSVAKPTEAIKDDSIRKSLFAVFAELLFVLLPFVVTAIVFAYKGQASKLLSMSEWSIAASVLIGQALVRVTSAVVSITVSKTKIRYKYIGGWEAIAFLMSLIIVLLLVPSLLVLSFVMMSENVSTKLIILQRTLFIIGLVLYFGFGSISHRVATLIV